MLVTGINKSKRVSTCCRWAILPGTIVLTTSLLLGNVPQRHQNNDGSVDIDTLFRIGRGRAPTGEPAAAAEMTKWFNTNYHYMVPEFVKGQQFKLTRTQLLEEVDEALALGHKVKPVLLGRLPTCGWVK